MKVNACRKKTRAPRKAASGKRAQERVKLEELQQINLHAAGIDVGATENYVCVPVSALPEGGANVRSFGVFTQELDSLVEWLKASPRSGALGSCSGWNVMEGLNRSARKGREDCRQDARLPARRFCVSRDGGLSCV